jgi:hypothetical protein
MLYLPDVTLICVSSVNFEHTLYAFQKSMQKINFGDVKLISDQNPPGFVESGISIEKCDSITSIDSYSHYMIFDLYKHVHTSHCLVIQADGFVINPEQWDPLWLTYDYIGAPWEYVDHSYLDPWGNHHRVGNGGFSLRSKKLLEVPLNAYVHFDVNWGNFYKHMNANDTAEDGCICVHNRHIYEVLGCKFAPIEVASRFSHEKILPETKGIKPFGFHYHLPAGTIL